MFRRLRHYKGRIFFHCNDHAFSRIPRYRQALAAHREVGDAFEVIDMLLSQADQLWNFTGLMAFRPWGPKADWTPAKDFIFPKFVDGKVLTRAAQWHSNTVGAEMYLSLMELLLPAGTYRSRITTQTLPKSPEDSTSPPV